MLFMGLKKKARLRYGTMSKGPEFQLQHIQQAWCTINAVAMKASPVGMGVGTSLIWAADQTLPPCESLATRDYNNDIV